MSWNSGDYGLVYLIGGPLDGERVIAHYAWPWRFTVGGTAYRLVPDLDVAHVADASVGMAVRSIDLSDPSPDTVVRALADLAVNLADTTPNLDRRTIKATAKERPFGSSSGPAIHCLAQGLVYKEKPVD